MDFVIFKPGNIPKIPHIFRNFKSITNLPPTPRFRPPSFSLWRSLGRQFNNVTASEKLLSLSTDLTMGQNRIGCFQYAEPESI
jgi:hypothetical protein